MEKRIIALTRAFLDIAKEYDIALSPEIFEIAIASAMYMTENGLFSINDDCYCTDDKVTEAEQFKQILAEQLARARFVVI